MFQVLAGAAMYCTARGFFGIAHVDDGKALGEHVPDIGVAAMHHHLHAVGPAALIGVADDAHVAREIRFRQVGHL